MNASNRDEALHGFEDILGALNQVEGELLEEGGKRRRVNSGEKIIEALARGTGGGNLINVIPGGTPTGCKEILVVAIGYNDSANERILEAVEHIKTNCPGTTRKVLFLAAWWGVPEWRKHRASFTDVRVLLKIIGERPIPL
jgi:hypothetical protein